MFSTHPGHLMTVLDQKGLPAELTYILGSTLQIIPQIQARAVAVQAALRSRGLETEGNLVVRSKALLPFLMPLLLGSLLDVEERAMALEARAFRSEHPKSSLIEIPDPVIEGIGRWVMVVLSFGLVIASRLL